MDTDVRLGQWTYASDVALGVTKDGRAEKAGVGPEGGASGIGSTPGAAPGRHQGKRPETVNEGCGAPLRCAPSRTRHEKLHMAL